MTCEGKARLKMGIELAKGEEVQVFFRCPVCKKTYAIMVDSNYLKKAEGGITSIPFEHGEPPHLLVIQVDTFGMVRGTMVYEKPKVEATGRFTLKEIVDSLGSDLMATITFWYLANRRAKPIGADKDLTDKVNFFLDDFLKPVLGNTDESINLDINDPKKPYVTLEPLVRIFKPIQTGKVKLAEFWIKRELERLREGLDTLNKLHRSRKTYTKSDLLGILGAKFRYDEIILLIETLRYRGLDVDSVFDVKEIKIKRLFEDLI